MDRARVLGAAPVRLGQTELPVQLLTGRAELFKRALQELL